MGISDRKKKILAALVDEYIKTAEPVGSKAIAKLAYSDKYGARDIRRIIRKEVEDKIANIMIDSDDARLSEIVVTAENGEIKVNGIEM